MSFLLPSNFVGTFAGCLTFDDYAAFLLDFNDEEVDAAAYAMLMEQADQDAGLTSVTVAGDPCDFTGKTVREVLNALALLLCDKEERMFCGIANGTIEWD
jgi:hypothetical protein